MRRPCPSLVPRSMIRRSRVVPRSTVRRSRIVRYIAYGAAAAAQRGCWRGSRGKGSLYGSGDRWFLIERQAKRHLEEAHAEAHENGVAVGKRRRARLEARRGLCSRFKQTRLGKWCAAATTARVPGLHPIASSPCLLRALLPQVRPSDGELHLLAHLSLGGKHLPNALRQLGDAPICAALLCVQRYPLLRLVRSALAQRVPNVPVSLSRSSFMWSPSMRVRLVSSPKSHICSLAGSRLWVCRLPLASASSTCA